MSNPTRQKISSVDRMYGQALVELADQAGDLDQIAQQVEELRQILADHPELSQLFSVRTLTVEQRKKIVQNLFEGRLHDELYYFLQVVSAKHRLGDLDGILRGFLALVDEKRGLVEVDVFVASPLTDEMVRCVADGVGRSLGKQVRLNQHIDERLIGGLKLRVGDRLLDASVASQLRQMQQRLERAGRARARELVEQYG